MSAVGTQYFFVSVFQQWSRAKQRASLTRVPVIATVKCTFAGPLTFGLMNTDSKLNVVSVTRLSE